MSVLSRPIEGTIKTCTIKREADGWYVVFAVECNQSRFIPKTGKATGIDLGMSFAAVSNGERVENPKHYRAAESELREAQRTVARRKNRRSNRRRGNQYSWRGSTCISKAACRLSPQDGA
ncbi:MAG: transposase [Acidobacteria bacterium]|nr:transposase [Acidobacteriota bacterium]